MYITLGRKNSCKILMQEIFTAHEIYFTTKITVPAYVCLHTQYIHVYTVQIV